MVTSNLDITDVFSAAKKGDGVAFQALADEFRHVAMNGARSVFNKDFQAAEDVVSETFVKLWRNLSKIREPSFLRSWIWKTARRTALSEVRKRVPTTLDPDSVCFDWLTAPADCPRELEVFEDKRDRVQVGMQDIKPMHREALELYYLRGLSNADAAKLAKVSVGSFRRRLCYARKELREVVGIPV